MCARTGSRRESPCEEGLKSEIQVLDEQLGMSEWLTSASIWMLAVADCFDEDV